MNGMIVFLFALCVHFGVQFEGTDKTRLGLFEKLPLPVFRANIPGTKWCGDGTNEKNDDDLGFFEKTDMCCRAHAHCKDVLDHGEIKHNLVNNGKYTRYSCDCDSEFYNCLQYANTPISHIVGVGYFNVRALQCFREISTTECDEIESRTGTRENCWEWVSATRFK